MTELLVSVRDGWEARHVVAEGVRWIDVKEPRAGALGAARSERIREVLAVTPESVTVSVALGELVDREDETPPDLPPGVSYVKLGLSGCRTLRNWQERWSRTLGLLPAAVKPVAVAYADWRTCGAPPPGEIIRFGVEFGCDYLLVDTFDKGLGGILCHLPQQKLAGVLEAARRFGLRVAVGGSLNTESIQQILPLEPDLVAVRSAACWGGRVGRICPEHVRALAELVAALNPLAV